MDYRSALVMAAALGGSALAQAAPVRTHAQHYWTGTEESGMRRSIAQSLRPLLRAPPLADRANHTD